MRRRQQIGRGMRLPVMANGHRVHDDTVNQLTVIAGEPFARFAAALQREIEDETGIRFGNRIADRRKREDISLKDDALDDPNFVALWEKVSQRTTYQVEFDTEAVVANALARIADMPRIEKPKFRLHRTGIKMNHEYGVENGSALEMGEVELVGERTVPDLAGEITKRVNLSRATVSRILGDCDRLSEARNNPAVFIDQVVQALDDALFEQIALGIVYHPTGERWRAERLENTYPATSVSRHILEVTKSITDKVALDSNIEVEFAKYLEDDPEILLYIKLPSWFKVDTPIAAYNPDWAIVRDGPEGVRLYLVGETKGGDDFEKLRWEHEKFKIICGGHHFTAIDVPFKYGKNPVEVDIHYPGLFPDAVVDMPFASDAHAEA